MLAAGSLLCVTCDVVTAYLSAVCSILCVCVRTMRPGCQFCYDCLGHNLTKLGFQRPPAYHGCASFKKLANRKCILLCLCVCVSEYVWVCRVSRDKYTQVRIVADLHQVLSCSCHGLWHAPVLWFLWGGGVNVQAGGVPSRIHSWHTQVRPMQHCNASFFPPVNVLQFAVNPTASWDWAIRASF